MSNNILSIYNAKTNEELNPSYFLDRYFHHNRNGKPIYFDLYKIVPTPKSLNLSYSYETEEIPYLEKIIEDIGIKKLIYSVKNKETDSKLITRLTSAYERDSYSLFTNPYEKEILKISKNEEEYVENMLTVLKNNFENYGCFYSDDWRVNKWGTKWNTYDCAIDEERCCFSVIEGSPVEAIKALSNQNRGILFDLVSVYEEGYKERLQFLNGNMRVVCHYDFSAGAAGIDETDEAMADDAMMDDLYCYKDFNEKLTDENLKKFVELERHNPKAAINFLQYELWYRCDEFDLYKNKTELDEEEKKYLINKALINIGVGTEIYKKVEQFRKEVREEKVVFVEEELG